MSNMSEDIQYAGSDTRPPMLDRTDYESWQQRIHLYCLGKDNGKDIMKSINEGPFQIGTYIETVTGGAEGVGNMNLGQAKPIKCYNCNGIGHIARQLLDEEKLLFLAGEQVTNFDDDVDDPPEQDLTLNVHHSFEADQCDAFDFDVDEAPTTQTMFMVNLSSEDPIYDEAWPSYGSKTSSEVQDHDNFADNVDEYHEVHEMQNDVQYNYVVDSDTEYTSDSNIILYDQYVEDNKENVVQSNVSFVQNDALMSIIDEMHKQDVQSRLANNQDKVVNDSLTSELVRYKELVGMYKK
ncbi:retrovirus-related pol polyprotein from transposon TNT 1-94 [Tanacetum coccineum]